MSCIGQWKTRDRGQALPFVAVFMVVLIGIVGLAIDGGLAYITKAHLSRAVDAASLTASRSYFQGEDTARAAAQSSFAMNYAAWRGAGGVPNVVVDFKPGADGMLTTVTATTTVNTYFARIFGWGTVTVGSTAQSLRNPLIMTLVLDRSGSMGPSPGGNNGGAALKNAVPQFVRMFNDTVDNVALVSFASTDHIDFELKTGFQQQIINQVNGYNFTGATFTDGGMADAFAQNTGSTAQDVQGKPVKVVVFLTDGVANTIQDSNLGCTSGSRMDIFNPVNYGGHDLPQGGVGFFGSAQGTEACYMSDNLTPTQSTCSKYYGIGFYCTSTRFTSQKYGNAKLPFSRANISAEAEYRSLEQAKKMRTEGGMYVYSVGLGDNINQSFLLAIANDKRSSSFNSSLPEGHEYEAPDCKKGGNATLCKAEVNTIFYAIASKVLARLTK